MPRNDQSKYFSITTNNPTAQEYSFLSEHGDLPAGISYATGQLEQGDAALTLHLQAYIELDRCKTILGVKRTWRQLFQRSHIEIVRSREQCRDYCRKEDTRVPDQGPWEKGAWVAGAQGRRTDGQRILDLALGGASMRDIVLAEPNVVLNRSNGVSAILAAVAPPVNQVGDVVLRRWQSDLMTEVLGVPHDRAVFWIYDRDGNQGKSFLAKHLIVNHSAMFLSGKDSDMAMAWSGLHRVALFDLPRLSDGYLSAVLPFAEKLKNGFCFSGKYQSVQKVFAVPHVIFFANFLPTVSNMSMDRWRIWDVTGAGIGGAPVMIDARTL